MARKNPTTNANFIAICRRLNEKGFVSAYGGNVSVRAGSKITITPAKRALAEIKEDDLVVIDMDGKVMFGVHEPSTEVWIHLKIYQMRPNITSVVHTHPPICTTFTYAKKEIVPMIPEAYEYLCDIPMVPKFPSGSMELAEATAEALTQKNVALLLEHGLVTIGESLSEAYNITELAEKTAQMNLYLHLLEDNNK